MQFQTKIPLLKQSKNQIDYTSKILLLGSCFSENIGDKFDYFKFQNTQNPLGILFHPIAIEALIEKSIKGKQYTEDDVLFHNELWYCFDAHSKYSDVSKSDLLNQLNSQLAITKKSIAQSTQIIITFGTAWVYRFLKTHKIVANCHKVPQKEFKKELLSVDDICQSLKKISALIASINSKARILFTVSPVRHLKDGFIENTQSKAHLISAIHQFLDQSSSIGNNNLSYFPSYEIMMDELRDYRFYAEDMIHPNKTAVNYIWECFKAVWVSEASYDIMDKVDTIQKGLQHKPFNANSEAHKKFLKTLELKKREVSLRFSHITF